MRYWSLLVAGGGAILIACQLTPNPNVTRWTLVELWQLHDSLARPESALFDAASGVIYVSNINGGPLEKDGNGFISRISPEGRLLEARWVSGLHAPKGMALSRGHLYVADIDTLVEIDVATGQITARYGAPGARFLNDVTVDTTGNVYVSDSQTHRIYRLQGDAMEVWLESPLLRSPNGLYALPTYLVVAAAVKIPERSAIYMPFSMPNAPYVLSALHGRLGDLMLLNRLMADSFCLTGEQAASSSMT